ncbi:Hypothetical Protein XCAW_03388 [Xanthomonas citri subsp. citri Aw12879]|nr:Hypothetical Protein XCAW_03388 [Xanthomonas citri subsp. citri Aw12879]
MQISPGARRFIPSDVATKLHVYPKTRIDCQGRIAGAPPGGRSDHVWVRPGRQVAHYDPPGAPSPIA